MARYAMETRAATAKDLEGFETGGYRLDPARSTPEAPAFVRDHPEAAAA